jgi:hypothetical protein
MSSTILERRIEEWAEMALSIEAEPSPEESEWDWMDEEYARRKLGLLPRLQSGSP